MFGLTPWSRRVAEALLQTQIDRFQAEVKISTHDKTTLYLARTFRRYWAEQKADLGQWECIGREFEAVWEEDDALAAKLKDLGGSK